MTPTTRWMERAACRGKTHLFWPPGHRKESTWEADHREQLAVACCRRCTVLADCERWLPQAERDDPPMHHAVAAGQTPATRRPALARPMPLFEDERFYVIDAGLIVRSPPKRRTPDPRDELLRRYQEVERRIAQLPLWSADTTVKAQLEADLALLRSGLAS